MRASAPTTGAARYEQTSAQYAASTAVFQPSAGNSTSGCHSGLYSGVYQQSDSSAAWLRTQKSSAERSAIAPLTPVFVLAAVAAARGSATVHES